MLGAAMLVSLVGFVFDTFEDVLVLAAGSAAVTHDCPDGTKGAQIRVLAPAECTIR